MPSKARTADRLLPLEGVRILDLTTLTPGPFATMMLAELGASVIKVERPGAGDPLRAMLPASFAMLNRGKTAISLDLKSAEDRDFLLMLAAEADVLVEGFRPGVMERLGLGFQAVRARNPRIGYVSVSGYGQRGPLAQDAGHDLNYVAQAGGIVLSGIHDGLPGYDGTFQIADLAGASYTVIAVLAALREPDAAARHIDISLFGAALAFGQLAAAEACDSGYQGQPARRPREQRGGNGTFHAADGLPLTVCAVEDHFFARLCTVLGTGELADDPRFATYKARLAHGAVLNERLAAEFGTRDREEWLALLKPAGIPCSPVTGFEEARSGEQARALGLTTRDPFAVALPLPGLPRRELPAAAGLGEHDGIVRRLGWDAAAGKEH